MPKSVDVEGFAAKLALLAKRLNWSRAKLAQQVGVDKSLAARWLNGNSRPTGNSLMQLTTAVAQAIEGFTAADWDLTPEQFARRLGLDGGTAPQIPNAAPRRLTLSGLHNPPDAMWGDPYLGLWAGFYQSLTNRGMVRLCVCRFASDDLGLRFEFTDGYFRSEGPALATHTHVHATGELRPLDNHLTFFSFHGAKDQQGAMVIDGLVNSMGPDDTFAVAPMLLFRVDRGLGVVPELSAVGRVVGEINQRGELAAAKARDAFGIVRGLAPDEVLRALCPRIGTPREDGEIDHTLRAPRHRSFAIGMIAHDSLPPDAPLRAVPANLRRVLGLDGSPQAIG